MHSAYSYKSALHNHDQKVFSTVRVIPTTISAMAPKLIKSEPAKGLAELVASQKVAIRLRRLHAAGVLEVEVVGLRLRVVELRRRHVRPELHLWFFSVFVFFIVFLVFLYFFSVFKGVLVLYSVFKGVLVLYSVFKGVLVLYSVFKGVLVLYSVLKCVFVKTQFNALYSTKTSGSRGVKRPSGP